MSEATRQAQRDAKERAAEALRNVGKSTRLPPGLRWLEPGVVQVRGVRLGRSDEDKWR